MVTSGTTGALACGGFEFAAICPPAAFDIFHWLQVTNYGVLYVLFDSAPSGSNHIDIWDLFLHLRIASTELFRGKFLARRPGGSKPKKMFDDARELMPANRLYFLQFAAAAVCFDRLSVEKTFNRNSREQSMNPA